MSARADRRNPIYVTDAELEDIVAALDKAAECILDIDDPRHYEQEDLDEMQAQADAWTALSMRWS